MKKPEQVSDELKNHQWPEFSTHPFIDEVLFKAIYEQIKDDEQVVSQLWGIRLNEQGELGSIYELLTLTDNHLISVYSDLENENDKVHIFSQPLKEVQKFSIQPSKLHQGYVRININLNGVVWNLESDDLKTADHFKTQIDQLLLDARYDKETEVATTILQDDVTSDHSLKTVQTDYETKKSKKAKNKEWNKRNLAAIKKYAKNNIIWYSIIIIASFFGVAVSATYIGMMNTDINEWMKGFSFVYSHHKTSLEVAGAFALIFSICNIVSYIMLTMKVWDKDRFSKNLYRVLFQLVLSVLLFVFSIILIVQMNSTAFVSALYMLPISLYLCVDATYLLLKTYFELNQVKELHSEK